MKLWATSNVLLQMKNFEKLVESELISPFQAIDYDETGKDAVNALYGLPLRDAASHKYFNLKRHLKKEDKKASFFVAEASQPRSYEAADPHECALHLEQPEILKTSASSGGFKNWGLVKTENAHDNAHRLFHAENQISYVAGTLPDMLKNENAPKMTPRQRVELATLIAMSYIHFKTVRPSCQAIRPSSFLYYSTSEAGDQWMEDDPPIMKPYLDFGFGQRPPQRVLGESSGFLRSDNAVIVELGLLLYQIGSCRTLKYGSSPRALAEAKRVSGFNLHLLDLRVSMAFAEVTEACLQYTPSAARALEDPIHKFLEGVVSRLLSLQEDLNWHL
jgi:hypothetical protein